MSVSCKKRREYCCCKEKGCCESKFIDSPPFSRIRRFPDVRGLNPDKIQLSQELKSADHRMRHECSWWDTPRLMFPFHGKLGVVLSLHQTQSWWSFKWYCISCVMPSNAFQNTIMRRTLSIVPFISVQNSITRIGKPYIILLNPDKVSNWTILTKAVGLFACVHSERGKFAFFLLEDI